MPLSSRHVVVSPHPDDAALSLGACISAWRRGNALTTIVTVFDGEPTAALPPAALEDRERYDGDPVALRKGEDRSSADVLGADLVTFDLPELVYRWTSDGRPRCESLEDIYGPLRDDDDDVIREVVQRLQSLSIASDDIIHIPLATGGHSDHRIVRVAAEAAFGARVRYFDDLPYAIRLGTHDSSVRWPPLIEIDVDVWLRSIECHQSQLINLFGTSSMWRDDFRAFAATKGSAST